MHYTYWYDIILHLADNSQILLDSQMYPKQLSEEEITKMLNDCMHQCTTKPYLQLCHAIIFTNHIVKIDIDYRVDSYY